MRSYIVFAICAVVLIPSFAHADFWSNLRDRIVEQVLPNNGKNGQQTSNNDIVLAGDQSTVNAGSLRSGSVIVQCGCNGNIMIGTTRQNSNCASGIEQTVQCNGECVGGGYPWGSVCQ